MQFTGLQHVFGLYREQCFSHTLGRNVHHVKLDRSQNIVTKVILLKLDINFKNRQ